MKQIKRLWPSWRRAGLLADKGAPGLPLFKTSLAQDYRVVVDLGAY